MKNETVIAELKKIASANKGILLPETVVEEAKRKTSPLHDQFEWNNSKAGEQWRIHTARQLINVCVELIGPEEEQIETKVFVSLRQDREQGGYRMLDRVMSSKSLREYLLEDAMQELKYFREKYKTLNELAELFDAADRILIHK